jgi:uncharacterized protein (DUF305 family)
MVLELVEPVKLRAEFVLDKGENATIDLACVERRVEELEIVLHKVHKQSSDFSSLKNEQDKFIKKVSTEMDRMKYDMETWDNKLYATDVRCERFVNKMEGVEKSFREIRVKLDEMVSAAQNQN